MNLAIVAGALVAGLLSSGHCVAMCGGIGAALASSGGSAAARSPLFYNLGRVTSYATIGALAGVLGAGALALTGGTTLRLVAQELAALALVALGLRLALRWRWPFVERAAHGVWRAIAPLSRAVLPARTRGAAFAAGMIWGWLPCGLAYAMLSIAALTIDPLASAATMAAFGIGTLPALLAFGTGMRRLGTVAQDPLRRRVAGAMIAALGALAAAGPWLAHPGVLAGLLDCAR